MKKFFVVITVLGILVGIGVYLFLPSEDLTSSVQSFEKLDISEYLEYKRKSGYQNTITLNQQEMGSLIYSVLQEKGMEEYIPVDTHIEGGRVVCTIPVKSTYATVKVRPYVAEGVLSVDIDSVKVGKVTLSHNIVEKALDEIELSSVPFDFESVKVDGNELILKVKDIGGGIVDGN